MEFSGVEMVLHSVRPGGGVEEEDRVERDIAEERMRELEIKLIKPHGLGEQFWPPAHGLDPPSS